MIKVPYSDIMTILMLRNVFFWQYNDIVYSMVFNMIGWKQSDITFYIYCVKHFSVKSRRYSVNYYIL